MATPRYIKRFCKQTAVYWGNPRNDGYGRMLFDSPIEIKCNWKENKVIRLSEDNKEVMVKDDILVLEPLDIQGYLYLGCLADLEHLYEGDGTYINPYNVEGACEITEVVNAPVIWHRNTFVHKVTVGFSNILRTKKQYASRNQ